MNADSVKLRTSLQSRPAMSIVESLMGAMIIAIVGSVAMLPFVAGMQHVQEATKLERAISLGQALMEEILARPYDVVASSVVKAAPVSGDLDRSDYTTIKQFNGYSESDGQARDFKGTIIASESVDGYWRTAAVQSVTYPEQAANDTGSIVRIQVRVYLKDTLMVRLDRLATREY